MKSILLLHGALGSKNQFNSLIRELEKSRKVYAFNFEGHGGRASNQAFTMENFVNNVFEFMDVNSLENVDVFGYSMGGYVALNCALIDAARMGKIITLGTKFDWTPESAVREVKMLNPSIIEEKVPKFAQKLIEEHSVELWKDVLTKTAEMMLGLGNGGAIPDVSFEKIQNEIVLCRGTEDQMVSKLETEKVCSLIPKASHIELDNITHPIERVDVSQLVKIIMNS
ncbi:MAG: alpha/beta hydrolase [Crocinitomicaceae bacterium]|jgi:pimeloyl-ACP methyl ester carboxylesterase|nr:alpha/beta hydrolase [Crocinitomicaceae bacterium]